MGRQKASVLHGNAGGASHCSLGLCGMSQGGSFHLQGEEPLVPPVFLSIAACFRSYPLGETDAEHRGEGRKGAMAPSCLAIHSRPSLTSRCGCECQSWDLGLVLFMWWLCLVHVFGGELQCG